MQLTQGAQGCQCHLPPVPRSLPRSVGGEAGRGLPGVNSLGTFQESRMKASDQLFQGRWLLPPLPFSESSHCGSSIPDPGAWLTRKQCGL